MDEALRSLEQAALREPENAALRERFLRACARAEDPALAASLELMALFLEGLAAVAFTRPEVAEIPPEEGARGARWLIDHRPEAFCRSGPEALAFELVGERLARPDRVAPRPYAHAVGRPESATVSLWEAFEDALPELARLALTREASRAEAVGVADALLSGISDVIYACFENSDYYWAFALEEVAEPVETSGPGGVGAVPRLFPVVDGSSSSWGGSAPADGRGDGPMSPFLRGIFHLILGPDWALFPTERQAKGRATHYQYKLLRGRERSLGFEIHYD